MRNRRPLLLCWWDQEETERDRVILANVTLAKLVAIYFTAQRKRRRVPILVANVDEEEDRQFGRRDPLGGRDVLAK